MATTTKQQRQQLGRHVQDPRLALNQLLIAILFLAAGLDAPARTDREADWRKVDEASSYMGREMYPPKFVDINSALLTSDGYIVFRQIAPIPTYEMRNGKVYANRSKRNFENRWEYYGIDCKEKYFASSKQYPRFKSSARHYGKDVIHNGIKVYNNKWPRNVEKLLCDRSNIRPIPHKVGQILFLNYIEGKNSNIKPLRYDEAVMLGVIK